MDETSNFSLTNKDKLRYEQEIEAVDISRVPELLKHVPDKLEGLIRQGGLNDIEVQLIEDVSKLVMVLRTVPDMSADLVKRIAFALQYFVEGEDEIPDDIPDIGLLDDAVVVRWVVDQILSDYSEYFKA